MLEKNCLQGEPFRQIARGNGEYLTLDCGVLFRSIGYRGVPIQGVPYDEARGVFPNEEGRIVDSRGRIIPGLYVAGWIKRGPTGIIGTNRADAVATIKALLGDLPRLDIGTKTEPRTLFERLKQKGARIVDYQDWLKLDAIEVQRGQSKENQERSIPMSSRCLTCWMNEISHLKWGLGFSVYQHRWSLLRKVLRHEIFQLSTL